MKWFLFVFLIMGCSAGSSIHSQSRQSKTVIVYSGENNDAIHDLRNTLRGYKAGTIVIEQVPTGGSTGQEFYMEITGNRTLLRYTTKNSLENAVYTYLDKLGFKWYGPGDNWFVKPKKLRYEDFKGRWIAPTFRNRNLFGTGGLNFGQVQAYDPSNEFKARWLAWMRRNRFNADFAGTGHQGEAFYSQNKTLLDKHPEWFAGESGKKAGRFKIDNADAVKAYKDWINSKYQKANGDFVALGVDPADGRGGKDDPLPAKISGVVNHADKWWWLANEVAKDYARDKRVVVTMYAYGDGPDNARVPSFPLRENVYPVIIPYAFQTAYLPNQMIKKWAASITGRMGIYDYWNITQWSKDVPQFDLYSMKPRLKFWNENKIDGVYLETTNAAGPMGHALWLAGQLQWDLTQDFDSLYTQYLDDCFGKGAPFVKNMFDRWSRNYQDAADVAFSLRDLQQAANAVKNGSAEWKRINELKAYIHFLKLYYELDGTQVSKDKFFRYMYSIHHLLMVQTAAFVGQRYIPPFDKGNIVPSGDGIVRLSEAEIEKNFLDGLASMPKPYQLADVSFDLSKVGYKETVPLMSWRFGGVQCNVFFRAPYSGKVSLLAGAESNTPLRIFTADSVIIDEQVGTTDFDTTEQLAGRTWRLKSFSFEVKEGVTYFIRTRFGFSRVVMLSPQIVLFKHPGQEDFDNYQYPVQYFYVPLSAKEIVFYDSQPEGTNRRGYLIAPDGTKLLRQPTGFKNVYRVPVQPQFRGKVWTADFGHPTWKFLNIPNVSSLQEFTYKE